MAMVNILVKTFDGLALPTTLSLPLRSSDPISSIFDNLHDRLPCDDSSLLLSTVSGKVLQPSSSDPISSLSSNDDFLSLRLHMPLCGGKGGFGSQLRAAGGRMSSRKRKGQENNDSCRNLDGRRMRTVKEAKALAAYLEIKPDMDQKEREKRRERWEKVVENADDKIKGEKTKNERFSDTKWLDENEETKDRTRDAVLKAMKRSGGVVPKRPVLESGSSSSESLPSGEEEDNGQSGSSSSDDDAGASSARMTFMGFDEDDEFMSSSEDEEEGEGEGMEKIEEEEEEEGKGKGKAV